MKTYRVISVTSQKAIVEDDDYSQIECYLRGRFKQQFKRNLNFLRVGDFVHISQENGQNCIENVLPRTSKLSRVMPNYDALEQVLAANIDQILMINSFANPEFKLGLIDRYTIIAEKNEVPIIICFNKADLVEGIDVSDLLELYDSIGYTVVVTSTETGQGLETFKEILLNKVSVLSGHSGVGKSTLINQIDPELDIRTQDVSDYNEKGTHTTTLAVFYRMKAGGAIIDTPGIREFGLWGIEQDSLHLYFRDFDGYREQCKFYNCTHRHEPKCAVRDAFENDEIAESRYTNYLHMFNELDARKQNRYK